MAPPILVFGLYDGSVRQQPAVRAVAEAQHAALALVGLDHELIAPLGGIVAGRRLDLIPGRLSLALGSVTSTCSVERLNFAIRGVGR
jgi:hypothetical protein